MSTQHSEAAWNHLVALSEAALAEKDVELALLRDGLRQAKAALKPFVWDENANDVFANARADQQVRCDATVAMMRAGRAALSHPALAGLEERDADCNK